MFHLEMGTPEQFAALRESLSGAGFTEEALRQKLDLDPVKELDLVGIATRPPVERKLDSTLDAFIQLFVLGESLAVSDVAPLFPSTVWDALNQMRLVLRGTADDSRCLASVAIYPIRDLFLASDRWTNIDHSLRPSFGDIVYPALTKSAKQFLEFTSFEPCEDFLEVCAGTAPAALLAARSAKHVWATDIAERSIDFAKFNAALNGIQNVTLLQGDLYQPLEGRTFDRIAAHPPYVPVLKPAEIYYGGGEIGEEITQRVIAELPERLKAGGRLYCRTLGTDRPGQGFEQRVRRWLGERSSDFDVGLFVFQTLAPRLFALEETVKKNGGREELAQREALFKKNDVKELVTGVVVVQRHAERRPAFTIRRTMSGTPAAAVEWAMDWEAELHRQGAAQKLLQARPAVAPGVGISVRHILRDGDISPKDFTLSVEHPFTTDCKVQPWMVLLLPRCDGKTTVKELFEIAKQNEWIAPETPVEEFCSLLGTLISGGFLESAGFK